MPDLGEQQRAFAEKRRGKNEYYFSDPWHRKIAKIFERAGKKVSLRLLGKLLRIKPVAGPLPFDEIKSVLFLRTDGIGDAIVTTPLWRALKRRRPDIVIGVAGSYRNIPVLNEDPNVDHTYNFVDQDTAKQKAEIARAQAMNYDLVVGCTYHRTTKTAMLARRASKHGYTAYMLRGKPDNRVYLFSKIVFWETAFETPMVVQLQYMLEQVLGITFDDAERMPAIHIPKEARDAVNGRLAIIHARHNTSSLIVLNTESATPDREWGFANCIDFAERLISNHPEMYVALTSSPHRADKLIQYLADRSTHANMGYFPTASIFEAAALIDRSALVVSPDTSIVHIANALAKPIVGLYLKDNEWKPYRVPSYVFIGEPKKPISATIGVPEVLAAANDLLDPNSRTTRENKLHTIASN